MNGIKSPLQYMAQLIYLPVDLSPEPVRFSAGLPQLDRAVLAPRAVEFAVWRIAYGPDRAVMTFLNFCKGGKKWEVNPRQLILSFKIC